VEKFGLSAALLTPFSSDFEVDTRRMTDLARNVLNNGTDTVTFLGTTGEGASVGTTERARILQAAAEAEIDADRIILGICASSVSGSIDQIEQGVASGVTEFLLTPPFYFSDYDDDALFNWHSGVLRGSPEGARFVVYNIPQVTGVTLSAELIGRLADAFPGLIRAVKDSSGSWASTENFLRADVVPVLVGDERQLARAIREGAAGAISGMANLHPEFMRHIVDTGEDNPTLSAVVDAVVSLPVVAAIKCVLADDLGDPGWQVLRPPLRRLADAEKDTLRTAVAAARG
jgi:4-hydroxy-tetrahydrodipicolinate synthase